MSLEDVLDRLRRESERLRSGSGGWGGRTREAMTLADAIDVAVQVIAPRPHVPPRIVEGLERYKCGIPTGACMRHVLEGDLFGAMRTADPETALAMPAIVEHIRATLPPGSYGSPESVTRWLARGRS